MRIGRDGGASGPMERRGCAIGVAVRAGCGCLEGRGVDAVISRPVRVATMLALQWWFRGPIQVLLRISLAMGFDARRERSGDGDGDLVEGQRASALRQHRREEGGEDAGEDSGGDSSEDTREEDKEERRRGRSTTTTFFRVDQDARAGGRAAGAAAGDAGGEGARAGGLAP
jgi:hypothetical protein